MDVVDAGSQLLDLGRYVFGQVDFPVDSLRIEYGIIAFFVIVNILIISYVWRRFRSQDMYIEDGVFLLLEKPPIGESYNQLPDLCNYLSDVFLEAYKTKKYFTLEWFSIKDKQQLAILIPRTLYESVQDELHQKFQLSVYRDNREDIITAIPKRAFVLDLELKEDFAFPLDLGEGRSIEKLSSDTLYVQLCCRPAKKRWTAMMDRYINALQGGKHPSLTQTGCSGGCIGVLLPFFSIIGDVLTALVHGSAVSRSESEKQINHELIASITKKKEEIGFEVFIRLVIVGEGEGRQYQLAEHLIDVLGESPQETNALIVKKFHKKLTSTIQNELVLSYMSSDTIDILTTTEIDRLMQLFS